MYLGSNNNGSRGSNVAVFLSSNVLPQQSLPSLPRSQPPHSHTSQQQQQQQIPPNPPQQLP